MHPSGTHDHDGRPARELPRLYRADPHPVLVDVPPLDYLMIDGHGDPNTAPEYAEAVQALYSVAFTLRFALERGPEPEECVLPARNRRIAAIP